MTETPHELTGVFYVHDAEEADQKGHAAAGAYFGDTDYVLTLSTSEIRTLGDQVLGYEVTYAARRPYPNERIRR